MNRTFKKSEGEIIKISNTLTIIVDEILIYDDEWLYDESPERGLDSVRKLKSSTPYLGGGHFKIVATIGYKLDDVIPLIEIPKWLNGIDYDLRFKECGNDSHAKEYWDKGYKAAQTKGCYTCEDLYEVVRYAVITSKDSLSIKQRVDNMVEVLKLPEEISEIELEYTDYKNLEGFLSCCRNEDECHCRRPKAIPINVKYE